jgi:hypoxanthine-guanine phosphoribosyltransferase
MNDSDHRDEIVRLEAQIDELTAKIESCRKFILVGRIAVVGGGTVLTAMLVSAIQFDPSVMALAVTAVLGGIVAAGSKPQYGERSGA